ncbi:MAG: hypothetical protein ACRD41_05425 [Candidatus Acidiferrales bacterium]
MAHSYLIFDFGSDEEAAQQARHKVEGWKQGFRLGDKMLLKFDREEAADGDAEPAQAAEKASKPKSGKRQSEKENKTEASERLRLFVRLDFSDHEKLSHHRWLERIPAEDPFKSVKCEIVRHGESSFQKTEDQFDSLD